MLTKSVYCLHQSGFDVVLYIHIDVSSLSLQPPTRPLPPAPESPDGIPGLLEHNENGHRLRTSVSEQIPNHHSLSLYEDPDTVSRQQNGRQPSPPTRSGYEEVPGGPNEPPVRRKPSPPRHGGYEEVPGGPSSNEPAVRRKPSPPGRGGYEEVPGGPSSNEPAVRRKPSPPLPRTRELSPPIYSQVDKSTKTKSRPPSVHHRTSPPREAYGQLNHFLSDSQLPSEYGKLVHTNKPPTYPPDEYGHLDHGAPTNAGASGYQPEEYGRLEHGAGTAPIGGYQPEEYGRLNRSREASPSSKAATPQSEEYGRLGPAFDPYGTLLGEDLEKTLKTGGKTRVRGGGYEMMDDDELMNDGAIYSEVDDEIKLSPKKEVPPPGYENHVLKVTAAERASYSRSSSQDDKSPTASPLPPQRSVKHKYVNVNEDGIVKLPPAPGVVPRKKRSNGLASPSDENIVGLQRGRSLEESSPPPPAPRQRATVHASRYSPPNSRPPTAPKPKPKP